MASVDDIPPPDENYGPAWYADPLGSTNRQRYWDGTRWTSLTRTGGAPPNVAPTPVSDAPTQPSGEAPPQGWYPDPRGATNRERYWSGDRWTSYTRAIGVPTPKTAKTWAAGITVVLLGAGALALGLLFGFLVAFDKSSPGFHESVRQSASSEASVALERTTTTTETETRQITTARPSEAP